MEISAKDLKIHAMSYWGKLQDKDFSNFHGDLEELKAMVHTAYGYTQDELDDEFKAFLKRTRRKQQQQQQHSP